jgi:hypothetical protein
MADDLRRTEAAMKCPEPFPGSEQRQCVHPFGHVTHWDGDVHVWLTTPQGYPQELAAAEQRGREQQRAADVEALRSDAAVLRSEPYWIEWRRASNYLAALPLVASPEGPETP